LCGAKREIRLVTNEEKTSLKAACVQAATTLIAARDSMKGAVDLDECVKLAAELYCRVTSTNWQKSTSDEAVRAGNRGSGPSGIPSARAEK
jgi:hypothetical protein